MDVQPHMLMGADNLPSGPGLQLANEQEVVRKAGRQAISSFLDSHNCFSVLRASGKVVVFDTRIPIQLAFYALVEHDMQAAPLWDSSICQFVGLLKVTDFIDILRHYKYTDTNVASLATRSIAEMISDPTISQAVGFTFGFPCADSSTTLKQACKLLLSHPTLDFLPIVMPEDMRVLACITYTNMLEHLVTHFREQRRLFDDSIYDLQIGTYHDKVIKAGPQESLAQGLELMHQHKLSALPVVDPSTDKLLGVYSRSDITFLTKATDAEDAVSNLDLKLQDILEQQRTDVTTPDAMHTCSKAHTLQSIFEYFAQLRFNRLFVVDESERLVGVVSAKDLVGYFIQ
ncbi:inosine-5'-monophosphate dehydrogenase [Nitzschia inconspicua]|uniref:Inosine-5'-monophosphate dehydrogenase n=1 Tax=Nitzschia inconspicua TaxID=303405 RepID=A0A9K3LBJ9_9STRA|nr:inosine-5'-monophosphate dehydrogenase [Nitzschia inconspicua]